MGSKLVCLCNFVSEDEIIAVLKKGARSTEEVQEFTRAGTSCGRCLVQIDQIVSEFINNQPTDAQTRLDF